jgi:hypothetical protein
MSFFKHIWIARKKTLFSTADNHKLFRQQNSFILFIQKLFMKSTHES